MGHSASAGRRECSITRAIAQRLKRHQPPSWACAALPALAFLLAAPADAVAQLPQTRLNAIFPTGGQAGTTVDVKVVAGEDLDELDRLVFNHEGIRALPKTAGRDGRQQPLEREFVVTIDERVPPGLYEMRAGGLYGLSNPRTFVVGRRREILETEPNDRREQAMELPLGTVVNGLMNRATDVDHFRFKGQAGQRIVIDVRAARIDSRMEPAVSLYDSQGRRLAFARATYRRDAILDVPLESDGEYILKLHDFTYQGGDEFFYRLVVHDGPHIDFVVPVAGPPGASGRFTLYGCNLPGGKPSDVELRGAKLEQLEVDIALPKEAPLPLPAENLHTFEAGLSSIAYTLESPKGESNPVTIFLAEAPIALEQESNDDPSTPQQIALPCEVVGAFQRPGDVDYFSFEAKKGDVKIIEVYGHRLGTSADPYLVLDRVEPGESGKPKVTRLSAQDDPRTNPDQNDPYPAANTFDVSHDDPVLRFQAPADGTYRITLRDRYFESRGDPSLAYRLVIRAESPDFRMVAVPAAITQRNQPAQPRPLILRRGETVAALVLAIRLDGFSGPIEVFAEDLPPGVTCTPAAVGENSGGAELVFAAAADAQPWSGHIRIRGRATIVENGRSREVIRDAQAGTIARKARNNNESSRMRLARTIALSVVDEQAPFQVINEVPRVEVHQGRQVVLPLEIFRHQKFEEPIAYTFAGIPRNANFQVANGNIASGRDREFVRMFVAPNTPPGTYSVYLNATSKFNYVRNPGRVARAEARQAEVAKAVAAAQQAVNSANTARDQAIREAARTAELAKQAQALKAQTEQKLQQAKAAVTAAEAEKGQADESVAAAEKALNAAAEDAAEQAQAALDRAREAQQAAEKKLDEARTAAEAAAAELARTINSLEMAQSAAKSAAEEKRRAEQASAARAESLKQVQAQKQAADREVDEARKAAQPRQINYASPSTPVVIVVREAPAKLSANVPGGGKLTPGGKLEVKVSVQREKKFAGPVTLSLPLPPGVTGLKADPVTIPADKKEGTLVIEAEDAVLTAADKDAAQKKVQEAEAELKKAQAEESADSEAHVAEAQAALAEAKHALQAIELALESYDQRMVVRAEMDYEGKAAIDAPIKLNVSK